MKCRDIFYLLLLSFIVVSFGCSNSPETSPKPELLVYCGMTMLKPIEEIAAVVELKHHCIVRVLAGGSGSLLRCIEHSGVGDLFLPGEESFIQQCLDKNLLMETKLVGYNQAALVVRKNNPLNIKPNIQSLADGAFSVILADPENGSIGRETKRILEAQGLFGDVLANSMALVGDSEDINEAIKKGVTDLSMNWYAVTKWPRNNEFIDAIILDDSVAVRKKLILGHLVFSSEKELARAFLKQAASEEGQRIFLSYGFFKPSDFKE